jgi:hypothetical protein
VATCRKRVSVVELSTAERVSERGIGFDGRTRERTGNFCWDPSWRGEDGAMYRFTVESGRLRTQSAGVQWTPSEPLGIGHYDSVKREDGTYRSYSILVDPYEDDADTIMNLIDDKISEVTA